MKATAGHRPGTRAQRRAGEAIERHARRKDRWGPWERMPLPNGVPMGGPGWHRDFTDAMRNRLYCVLIRPLALPAGEGFHAAITCCTGREPPWRDRQRIKNELFGRDRVAVEVMPADADVIDAADMFHLWVLPLGETLPFGLHMGTGDAG